MTNQTKETIAGHNRHLRTTIEQQDGQVEIPRDLIEGGRARELELLRIIKDLIGVGHTRG